MQFHTNQFRDDLLNEHGHVDLVALAEIRGASFDKNNDLWISHDGKTIHPRKGKSVSIEKLGLLGACCDAIMLWEREANGNAAYWAAHRQDPTELGFGGE